MTPCYTNAVLAYFPLHALSFGIRIYKEDRGTGLEGTMQGLRGQGRPRAGKAGTAGNRHQNASQSKAGGSAEP